MKKTLVKGLVALAAGALLAGGLLGCQQTVDSFTVKPSSLDSANVKAVHTPGFFALTWDRVKNCNGYDIEAKNVATGEIISFAQNLSVTKTDISVGDLWMTATPDVKDWIEKNLSPEKDYRAEYEFTVIARSSSASGRTATAVGVQNSYSSVRVVFESVPDDYAKPAVPSDVEATLAYKPLVEGKKTTTGTLSVSFTAKAGVHYGIADDLSQISVTDNNVDFMNAILDGTGSVAPFDGKLTLSADVKDVTPGKDYSYNLLAIYAGSTVSGNALYSVKELTVTPTAKEASANFAVSSDEKTAGDTVRIGAEWNKAYGGSLEYAVLTAPVAYNPGMTAAEIYAALGTKTSVTVSEDNVAPNRNVASFTVNRAEKDTVKYVVVILKKGDTYNMRTVTVAPKAATPEQRYSGYVEFKDWDTSDSLTENKPGVRIVFNDGTVVDDLPANANKYTVSWTEYTVVSDPAFNDDSSIPIGIPVATGKSENTIKPDLNKYEGYGKSIYEFNPLNLGSNWKPENGKYYGFALYIDGEFIWSGQGQWLGGGITLF